MWGLWAPMGGLQKGQRKGYGQQQWSVNTVCGLQEVRKGREASRGTNPLVSATSPKTAAEVKEESKPAQVVGAAFASLIAEESDEEDEAPGFQSQTDLYAEKERGQESHAAKEKKKKISNIHRRALAPPPPQPIVQRPPKKTKRTYMPFPCTLKPDESKCCPFGQHEAFKTGAKHTSCELKQQ